MAGRGCTAGRRARGLVLIGRKAGSGLPCQERSRPGTRLTTLLLVRHAGTMACSAELTDKGGGGVSFMRGRKESDVGGLNLWYSTYEGKTLDSARSDDRPLPIRSGARLG
jgi:hypothetical protein